MYKSKRPPQSSSFNPSPPFILRSQYQRFQNGCNLRHSCAAQQCPRHQLPSRSVSFIPFLLTRTSGTNHSSQKQSYRPWLQPQLGHIRPSCPPLPSRARLYLHGSPTPQDLLLYLPCNPVYHHHSLLRPGIQSRQHRRPSISSRGWYNSPNATSFLRSMDCLPAQLLARILRSADARGC